MNLVKQMFDQDGKPVVFSRSVLQENLSFNYGKHLLGNIVDNTRGQFTDERTVVVPFVFGCTMVYTLEAE